MYISTLTPRIDDTAVDDPHINSLPVSGLIAIVGCDGTGKSTLTHDLVKMLCQRGSAKRRYLGLVSGETGDKIKRLPLIGVWLERRLAAKSEQAQNMRNQPPGVMAAILMYGFSLWRAWHLKRVQRLAERGVMVVTDRYPQAEIDGFHYDGPGIGVARSKQRLIRRLALRERRLYQAMAKCRPALIIRLGVDLDTAYSRKPDHDRRELRDKIAVMARLKFNGAAIFDLDTRAPYPQVLEDALRIVTERFRHTELPALNS